MTVPITAAMTGAELHCAREYLGLSTLWLSRWLDVGERKLMRWEAEELTIPDGVASEVDDLYEEAATLVARMSKKYRQLVKDHDGDDVEIQTYRTDDEYWRATNQPGVGKDRKPARWHRMICARVAEAVPGLVVTYG